jgi:hypothetical protein
MPTTSRRSIPNSLMPTDKIPARDTHGRIIQHPGLAQSVKDAEAERAATLPKR